MVDEKRYIVVLKYVPNGTGYDGLVSAMSFDSETAFREWYTPDLEKLQKITAKGVTENQAFKMVQLALSLKEFKKYLNPDEIMDKETGKINFDSLDMKVHTIAIERSVEMDRRNQKGKFLAEKVRKEKELLHKSL